MDDAEKEEIRARVDLVELVAQYTPVKQAGKRFKACCPFHQEKTPSFTIDPDLGRWRCFGACSTGGDIFGFLMKAENLSFPDAAERLALRAGITLKGRGGDTEASRRAAIERERTLAANIAAQKFFRETFARDSFAREYAQKRGLTHEIIEAFGIGYAPDDWSQLAAYLDRNKVNLEDAERAGLVYGRNYPAASDEYGVGARFNDKFRARLMFPILDVQDRTVGFGGRLLLPSDKAPKYLNSPETPVFSKSKILYGLNRARKAIGTRDLVLLVEGYMDVVACHQAGLEFAVATLGTSLTDDHVRLLRRYTKNVTLSFDADEAGVRAALRAAELFKSHGDDWTLRVLSLPPGEDPDSLLTKGEVAKFRKAIDVALTVPEFRIKIIISRFDARTEEGKANILREVIPIVAGVESPIDKDVLIRRIAVYHPTFSPSNTRAEEQVASEVQRWRQSGANSQNPNLRRSNYSTQQSPRTVHHSPQLTESFNPNNAKFVDPEVTEASGSFTDSDAPPPLPPDYSAPFVTNRITQEETSFQRESRQAERVARAKSGGNSTNPRATNPVLPPVVTFPKLPRTAVNIAEETIVRALLDNDLQELLGTEWDSLIGNEVQPELFITPDTVELVKAMLPHLKNRVTPLKALARIADPTLTEHAMNLLVAQSDEPLTKVVFKDCLKRLKIHQSTLKRHAKGEEYLDKVQALTTNEVEVSDEPLREITDLKSGEVSLRLQMGED